MIDLRKAVEALDIDDPFFGTRWDEQTGTYCSYNCGFTHQGSGHGAECPVTVLRKMLAEPSEEERKTVFEAIQEVLRNHRITWHGGGTSVTVNCRRMNCWSGEKVRTLDEAFTVYEEHVTHHIINALDGEE